jgi:DNA polymerase III delta subunit
MIAAMTNHFIRLWKLQDAVRQRKSEQEMLQYVYFNPVALKSSLLQVRNFRSDELENVFILLSEADLSAKSSGDAKIIMTKTIAEIISGTIYHQEEAAVT